MDYVDLLLGLDNIYKFKLNCPSNYQIFQQLTEENEQSVVQLIDPQINLPLNFHIDIESKLNSINNNNNLIKLLTKFESVFSDNKFNIGVLSEAQCIIELDSKIPINSKPYRTSPIEQNRIENEITSLLKANLIQHSHSPYASPVTLAFKREDNDKTRFCIDYRKLNDKVIPDKYPMPRIEDIIDNLHNNKYFSVFDVRSGFWHIRVRKDDVAKTAFITQNGHYEWLVMPFGFKNAPAIFQRAIRNLIEKYSLTKFCHNYIDDIIVYSPNLSTHIDHIEKLLTAVSNEGLKLNFEKCKIAQLKVNYLGHSLSLNEVRPLHSNVDSILKLTPPKTITELRRFLGKVNYNRKFINKISTILEPLHQLLRKENKFEWNESCQKSFDQIKLLLTSEPVLKMFNPNNELILETDASKIGIGAVLKQPNELNELHPIGYFSKKLTNYQQNYPVTHLECLAVVESIKYWHHYLYDRKFTVITDHSALTSIRKIKKPNSRLFTWAFLLGQYNFEIKYRPGSENIEADFLSREPISNEEIESPLRLVNFINIDLIKNEQLKLQSNLSTIVDKNGLKIKIDKNGNERIILPENLKAQVMNIVHEQFGHLGIRKMITVISWKYYWPKLTNDIINFVANCRPCQLGKTKRIKLISDFGQFGPPKDSFEIIAIDTICGLDGYKCKKKYIHLAVDHFSRFVWTIGSNNQTANEFIKLIEKIKKMGKPRLIVADQYKAITSNQFSDYLTNNNININFIPKSAPQCNGLCERVGNTIIDKVRVKMISNNYRCGWVKFLQRSVDEYNHSPHSTTQFTPYYLINGTLPPNCSEVKFPPLNEAKVLAYENSLKYHEKNKLIYQQHHQLHQFNPNDLVYIVNRSGINKGKLDCNQFGPFRIINQHATNIYNVAKSESPLLIEQVHSKHLIPIKST